MKQLSTDNINARITEKLSAEICPVHGCRPTIVWANGNLQIVNPCCDEFADALQEQAAEIAQESAADEIANQLNGLFKSF